MMFHVIDDDECLRELVVELLESSGYVANSYSSPHEYVDYLKSDNYLFPTATFTDIQMPGMSGYELIDIIREKFPEQKIVVMSGYHEGDAAMRNTSCHFLPKPFIPQQLFAIADALIRCNKEGLPAANSTCSRVTKESSLYNWSCPLDCSECGK